MLTPGGGLGGGWGSSPAQLTRRPAPSAWLRSRRAWGSREGAGVTPPASPLCHVCPGGRATRGLRCPGRRPLPLHCLHFIRPLRRASGFPLCVQRCLAWGLLWLSLHGAAVRHPQQMVSLASGRCSVEVQVRPACKRLGGLLFPGPVWFLHRSWSAGPWASGSRCLAQPWPRDSGSRPRRGCCP